MIHRAKRGADLALDLGTRTWAQIANSFDFFDGIGVSRRKPALPPFARLPRMLRGVDALLVVGKAFEPTHRANSVAEPARPAHRHGSRDRQGRGLAPRRARSRRARGRPEGPTPRHLAAERRGRRVGAAPPRGRTAGDARHARPPGARRAAPPPGAAAQDRLTRGRRGCRAALARGRRGAWPNPCFPRAGATLIKAHCGRPRALLVCSYTNDRRRHGRRLTDADGEALRG